jgi:conjugal transfer pilus assembly protein TraB
MSDLRRRLAEASPRLKRYGVIAAVVVALGLLIGFLDPGAQKSSRGHGEEVISNVLSGVDARGYGIDALAAQIKELRKSDRELARQIERLGKTADDSGLHSRSRAMREVERLRKALDEERDARKSEIARLAESTEAEPAGGDPAGDAPRKATRGQSEAERIFAVPAPPAVVDMAPAGDPDGAPQPLPPARILTISEPVSEPEPEAEQAVVHLVSGSIITGVIIAGLDAPTGQAARRDPFPMLLRVKHEAILPNRFRQDVRECFLTASGYGDLSSERAYLRAENISCVREDGAIVEQRLQAFATGEDGKTGIRGRLVSRQGQLIARSLLAGFASGVSDMFDIRAVPTIAVNRDGRGGNEQEYQRVLTGDAFKGAAVRGAGKALERIADYYLDMAENMYPVIEIDAGRQVDFIVQKGAALNGKG